MAPHAFSFVVMNIFEFVPASQDPSIDRIPEADPATRLAVIRQLEAQRPNMPPRNYPGLRESGDDLPHIFFELPPLVHTTTGKIIKSDGTGKRWTVIWSQRHQRLDRMAFTNNDEGIFLYVVLPEELREEQFFEYVAHSSTPNLGRAPDRITEPRQSRILHFLREQRTNIINEVNGSESDVSGYLFRIFEQAEIATGEFRRSSPDFLYNVVWSKRHRHFDRVAFRNEVEGTFEYMWLPDEVR